MLLSKEGKILLDELANILEMERPTVVKIALAKGIATTKDDITNDYSNGGDKWTIPDSIIKGNEFLLFKHLIINEVGKPITDEDELHQHMLYYIEKGLRILQEVNNNKNSLDDIRMSIL